ncbi:MAG TPA: hypothetical protein VF752_08730 [Thermoleophilaceae bacterium]
MSADGDKGVMGNLPRSRPGVRSEKRASSRAAKGTTAKPKAAPKPRTTARTKPAASANAKPGVRSSAASRAAAPPPPPPPEAGRRGPDPVTAAVQVAETGIKVASKVAGGILRRLPRP